MKMTKLITTATVALTMFGTTIPAMAQPVKHDGHAKVALTGKSCQQGNDLSYQKTFDHRTITVAVDPALADVKPAIEQAAANWNDGQVLDFKVLPKYSDQADIVINRVNIDGPDGKAGENFRVYPMVKKDGHLKQTTVELDERKLKVNSQKDPAAYQAIVQTTTARALAGAVGMPDLNHRQSVMNVGPGAAAPTSYDFGVLDRLYTNSNAKYSRVYQLPMDQGIDLAY